MKKIALLAMVFLSASASILILLVGLGGRPSVVKVSPEKEIKLCFNLGSGYAEYVSNLGIECLSKVLLKELNSNSILDSKETLETLSRANPGFSTLCHNSAHYAAKNYSRDKGFSKDGLRVVTTDLCDSGLLHGYFEGLNSNVKILTKSKWESVINICNEVSKKTQANCGDSVGHSATEMYKKNNVKAYGICALFSSGQSQRECAEGVVMEIYSPTTDLKSAKVFDKTDPNITCLPAKTFNNNINIGCAKGVGWFIGRNAQLLFDDNMDFTDGQVNQAKIKLYASMRFCESLESNSESCVERVLTTIERWVWIKPGHKEELCSAYNKYTEFCSFIIKRYANS